MSNITIDVKNDAMLGKMNDGVIATKLYSLEKKIEDLQHQLEEYQKALDETTSEKMDLENIIKEVRDKLNTQLAFTSSYQLNYQSAMSIIEETKSILQGVDKN